MSAKRRSPPARSRISAAKAPQSAAGARAKSGIYSPPLTTSRRDLIVNGTDEGFRESFIKWSSASSNFFPAARYLGGT